VRLQRRINGRVGATTGRINSQPKRSKHRGKNDPAEEEWIMLREKHLGVDELPQQWEEIKQTGQESEQGNRKRRVTGWGEMRGENSRGQKCRRRKRRNTGVEKREWRV